MATIKKEEPKIPTGANLPNPPALPGVGVKQPTREERQRIEDKWNNTDINVLKKFLELVEIVKQHPEFIDWMKGAVESRMELGSK